MASEANGGEGNKPINDRDPRQVITASELVALKRNAGERTDWILARNRDNGKWSIDGGIGKSAVQRLLAEEDESEHRVYSDPIPLGLTDEGGVDHLFAVIESRHEMEVKPRGGRLLKWLGIEIIAARSEAREYSITLMIGDANGDQLVHKQIDYLLMDEGDYQSDLLQLNSYEETLRVVETALGIETPEAQLPPQGL